MFLGGDMQGPGHARDVEPAIALGVVVELADRANQAITGVRDQREVKLAVQGAPLPQILMGHGVHPAKTGAHGLEVSPGVARHVDAERQRLVHDAHGVELLEVVDREGADAAAVIELGLDQAFPLQHPHGFSISLLDVAAFLAVGGVFFAVLSRLMLGAPLVPVGDPRLPESLSFENV